MIPHTPRPIEQLDGLQAITAEAERVTIGEVVDTLGENGFAITITIMAVMLVILAPIPGLSVILGIPMTVMAAQWAMGRSAPWLPEKMRSRSVAAADMQKALAYAIRVLHFMHPLVHPRGRLLRLAPFRKFALFVLLFLCFFVFLPIPFGNIPPAIAIGAIALAEMEDDGVLLAIGTIFGLLVAGGFITIGFFVLQGTMLF